MELREALHQISHIREQFSRGEVFRGYQSWTVGFSGMLAIVGALLQPILVPQPAEQLAQYLALWIGIALFCVLTIGVRMWVRCWRAQSSWRRQLTMQAVEHFLPCLVAGAIITLVLARRAPEVAWLLPGVWALLFSLGIFASSRILPRSVAWAGLYYLLCAVVCLTQGSDAALEPWRMGVTFGGGQLLTAVILYRTLERTYRDEQ